MSTWPTVQDVLKDMQSSTLLDYVIPGLNSSLFKNVRFFEMTRNQQHNIAPHSHRFDFACLVLHGRVTNRIWQKTTNPLADQYAIRTLYYDGKPGKYIPKLLFDDSGFEYKDSVYQDGQWYTMPYDAIHSINFSKGAKVIFFEGPQKSDHSFILEPYINGMIIPTGDTQPWMFRKLGADYD